METINFLQSEHICHRDINPNNIIIKGDKMTLIDFNVAKQFENTGNNRLLMMTNTGTAKYKAPEMLGGNLTHYDSRVDLWSAGAVLYYMLTGQHAFNFENEKDIENSITIGAFCMTPEYFSIS